MAAVQLLKVSRLNIKGFFPLVMHRNFSKRAIVQYRYNLPRYAFVRGMASQTVMVKDKAPLKYHNFDRAIFQMDMELKRIGRISRTDVNDLFNQVKRTGGASSTQGLMLLRCCGDVLVESRTSERMDLLDNILSYLKEKDLVFDVSHYNAILRVYLDNEYEFKPEDIVAEMDKNGIEPNRVTYQRLISRFCQMGDTNGASKVLEVMKSKSLPVNESIFNSLIIGHFKTNGMAGVAQMLEIMKASNLEPSEDTYTILLSCYAENGDWENMQKVFSELTSKRLNLSDRDYLKIVEALAKNGHSKFISEVLTMLPKTSGFNQEIFNSILRLVNRNQVDVAFTLLQMMFKPITSESESPSSGNFFIRQLVSTNLPIDQIISICKEMEAKRINTSALLKATEISMQMGYHNNLLPLFQILKDQNLPIRPHFFWPIFAHHRKMKDKKGILDTLATCLEFDCKPDSDTFIGYIFPAIDTSHLLEAISEIKDLGITTAYIVNPLVVYLINRQNFKEVLEIIEKFSVHFVPSLIIPALSKQAANVENIADIMKILSLVLPSMERSSEHIHKDFAGQFLLDSFYYSKQNMNKLKSILTAMVEQSILMSSNAVELLQNRLRDYATPDIIALISKLTNRNNMTFPYSLNDDSLAPHPKRLSVEDLECHLIELKNKNMNPRGVLRRLFLEHCRQRNFTRVEEIKSELDADGFEFSAGMLAVLMDLNVNKGDLDKALTIKQEIHEKFPDFKLDHFKVINLAIGMVKEGKMEEAFELISSKQDNSLNESHVQLERNVSRLLNVISEKGIVPTRKMVDLVMQLKYSEPSNAVLSPLIKAYLIENDIKGAIKEFEKCVTNYKLTPYKIELYKNLIELEDTENLQKVMDMTIKILGEMNTLHDLAIAFLQVGRVKQAKKVFETPGLKAKMERLINDCDRLINTGKIDLLENLVNITKDLFEIDRNAMYMQLLRGYHKLNDPQKALACWATMQEENLQPTPEVLRYLASILNEHKIKAPFIVPSDEVEEMKDMSEVKMTNKLIINDQALSIAESSLLIETLLKDDQITKAISITQSLLEQNHYPHLSVLRHLLDKLSLNGDLNMLHFLQTKLPDKLFGRIKMNAHIEMALINTGKEEEILQKWENQEESNIIRSSLLYLLKMKPKMLPRVEKICEKYVQNGSYLAASPLWQYYVMKEEYDKAIELIKKFPELPNHLRVVHICAEAKTSNKASILTNLIDILRPLKTLDHLAFTYSYLIGLQCSNYQYDAALDTLKQLEKDNLQPNDLQPMILKVLKKGLEESGKAVPFQIAKQTQKLRDDGSDSN